MRCWGKKSQVAGEPHQAAAKEGKPVARLAWRIRRTVVRKGWQHSRILGRPLRWLGSRLP